AAAEQTDAAQRPGGPRLLVVDDEAAGRAVTAGFLRDQGHEVVEAGSAAEGLEALSRDASVYDGAVVDFAMPEVNGVEFAQQARARRPALPIILLTGYFDVDVPTDVAVVHTPFSNATLRAALDKALTP
ncbi:MAG TPA: response regulator, partial [Phenylobacterium sp.]|nr:response regulator [Phenylobacterium sp.]